MANLFNPEKEGHEVEKVPPVSVHPEAPMCRRMVCFTAGGSPTWKGQYCPLHDSGSSVVSAGQLIMKVTSMTVQTPHSIGVPPHPPMSIEY